MLCHIPGICEWTVQISLIVSNGIVVHHHLCLFFCGQKPFLFFIAMLTLIFFFNRLIERTEAIKIFEVDRCRDIFNHQNRLQIFFPKQNICAGHSNGQSIKIVSKIQKKNDNNFQFAFHFLFEQSHFL